MDLTQHIKDELKNFKVARSDLDRAEKQMKTIQNQLDQAENALNQAKGDCVQNSTKSNLAAYTDRYGDVTALTELLQPIQDKIKLAEKAVDVRKTELIEAVENGLFDERRQYRHEIFKKFMAALKIEDQFYSDSRDYLDTMGAFGGRGVDGIFGQSPKWHKIKQDVVSLMLSDDSFKDIGKYLDSE